MIGTNWENVGRSYLIRVLAKSYSSVSISADFDHLRPTDYFLWLIFVVLETAAQLTLKMASGAGTTHYLQSIGTIVNSRWFMASIACDAANLIIWLAILRRHELSVAVPLTSMTYFAVLLASGLLLHEPVRLAQLMGLILIGGGVTLVSWNERLQDEGG
jgi:drug/metabolite transporter (DMT)-like permease